MKKWILTATLACGLMLPAQQANAQNVDYIVETKHMAALQKSYSFKKLDKVSGQPIYKIRLASSELKKLQRDARITELSKNRPVTIPTTEVGVSAKSLSGNWGLTSMHFPAANPFLAPVEVAIIDSGVDTDHPLIKNQLVDSYATEGFTSVEDEHGHGTHVAGIVAEGTPNVRIVPIRVLDKYGDGDIYNLVEGIYYAIEQDVDVINMSLGIGEEPDELLGEAITDAADAGIMMTAAAGNDYEDYIEYPASSPYVQGVGAYNSSEKRATFSHTGVGLDFMAPGYRVQSAKLGGGYTTMTGTSMATPFVSKALALAKSANPKLTSSQLEKLALSSTESFAGTSMLETGYGKINMDKLMAGAYATNAAVRYMTPKQSTDAFKTWTITMSAAIDTTAANLAKVSVVNEAGVAQAVTIQVGNTAKKIEVIAPKNGYEKGSHYYIQVKDGFRAVNGKALKQSTINSFTIN